MAIGSLLAGAALLVARVARPARWAVLALALFCIALVLLPAGRRGSPRPGLAAVRRWPSGTQSVDLVLTVTADPIVLAANGAAGAPRVAVPASAEQVRGRRGRRPGRRHGARARRRRRAWRDVLPGQRVRVDGASAARPRRQRAVGHARRARPIRSCSAGRRGGSAPPARSAPRCAARSAGLPDQERGLLPGLVDGDTSNLDPVLAERFRLAGLTHLVAVSGTNCSLVIGAVLLVLRRARARPWLAALVGAVVLAMFVVVARPSPSVLRAALMGAIALVALATGRPRAALPALAATVLALLVWDPTLSGSASFAMSVAGDGRAAGDRAGVGVARCALAGCRSGWPRRSRSPPRRTWSPRRSSRRSRAGSVWSRSRRTCWPSRSWPSPRSSGSSPR